MKKYRRPIYLSLFVSFTLVVIYVYLQSQASIPDMANTVMAICAIVAAVAFWLEYHHNNKVNEAQFIMDLNDQFIDREKKLVEVEHDLEIYNAAVMKSDQEAIKRATEHLNNTYAMEQDKRQDLVNYLVHLEGITTLVNNGVLRLNAINDLMAYRYFIAVNNPVVQELELIPYYQYYKGIIQIFDDWAKRAKNDMPLAGTKLSNKGLKQKLREDKRQKNIGSISAQ